MARHPLVRHVTDPRVSAVGASMVASLLLGVAQVVALGQTLPLGGLAQAISLMAVGTYVCLLAADGPSATLLRFPGPDRDPRHFIRCTAAATKGWAVLCMVGLLIAVVQPSLRGYVVGSLLWGASLGLAKLCATPWLLWGRPWRYAGAQMATSLAKTIVMAGAASVTGDAAVTISLSALAALIVAYTLGPTRRLLQHDDRPPPWPRWYGVQQALSIMGLTTLQSLSLVIAPYVLSPSQADVFSASQRLVVASIGALVSLTSTALFPRVLAAYENEEHERCKTLQVGARRINVLSTLIVAASLYLATPWLGSIVLPDGDVPGWVIVPLVLAYGLYGIAQIGMWQNNLRLAAHRNSRASLIGAAFHAAALLWAFQHPSIFAFIMAVILGFTAMAAQLVNIQPTRKNAAVAAAIFTGLAIACLWLPDILIGTQ